VKRYIQEDPTRIENLQLCETERPVPKRGQVLVRMRAASLNYRDLLIAIGRYRMAAEITTGFVPLSDGAGEVAEVGEDVDKFKPGDRVANTFVPGLVTGNVTRDLLGKLRGFPKDGVLAEYVVFEAQDLVLLPDELGYEAAACLPCAGVTAWNSLYCGPKPLLPGQTVLVLGTGGVSVFAVQLAHAGGARVIVTSSSDAKIEQVCGLGAWQGINYVKHPEWQEEVLRLTDGQGADHTVETGGPGTLPRSVAATRFGGSLGMIGVLVQGEINPMAIMHQGMVMRSVLTGSRTMLEDLVRAVDINKLDPVIDKVFPFAEAIAAYQHLEAAGHVGKVVITID
jgi:NADPH:quinone reductase-like Zn-dependent oxidoreductase